MKKIKVSMWLVESHWKKFQKIMKRLGITGSEGIRRNMELEIELDEVNKQILKDLDDVQ